MGHAGLAGSSVRLNARGKESARGNARAGLVLAGICAAALAMYLVAVRQDLPYLGAVDEWAFVGPAVQIAATGDLNPHWFGHPGSTIIYPVALAARLWSAFGRPHLFAEPNLMMQAGLGAPEVYLFGRLLNICFAVAALPLIYAIGRRFFGSRAALGAVWLAAFYPLAMSYFQVVRTDSSALFFVMLFLWLCVLTHDRPTAARQVAAGAALGLAISSRYLMASFGIALLAVDVLAALRSRREDRPIAWGSILAGWAAVPLTFALSTPYFFLDFQTALRSLTVEMSSAHLGADGLSRPGNFLWYVTFAIPASITWPQVMLAAIGIGLLIRRGAALPLILPLSVFAFLAGISMSPLHWQRWAIQVLPILALFAGYALDRAVVWLAGVQHRVAIPCTVAFICGLVLVSAWPVTQAALYSAQRSGYSTEIAARIWAVENLPPGIQVAAEGYTAPFLKLAGIDVEDVGSAAQGHTVDDYYRDGTRYLLVGDGIDARYYAEPQRYAAEIAFYEELASRARLVVEFTPDRTHAGPRIRVYELVNP